MKKKAILLSLTLSLPCALRAAESSEKQTNPPEWSLGLQELDLSGMTQGFGAPQLNKSIGGKPLSIGGRVFEKGLGTHSPAEVAFDLHGTARRFSAWVGVDDGAEAPGSVTFQVAGDGRILWESGVMKAGEAAKEVSVDLTGIRRLALRVGNGGDTNGMDHANWAEAKIDGQGLKPVPSIGKVYEIDLSNPRPLNLAPKEKWTGKNPAGDVFAANAEYLTLNGKPWVMVSGEIHPTRYPREQWEEAILKMKAGGINTVAMYFFWVKHEEDEGTFVWTGQRDLRHFIELCAKHGMRVFARIGPFNNGEVRNGGLPDFLKEKGVKFRTNDPVYLDYVKKWYQQVGEQLKGLMFKDGGPVIAVQLENEFEHAPTSWGFKGEGGEEHMLHLKRLAIEAGIVAPYYVATAWESPVPAEEMMPAWGGYAWICPGGPTAWYLFNDMHSVKKGEFITPAHNHRIGVSYDATQVPVANIETGPGFFCYGQWRPNIPPESSEAIAMMMTARGGNLLGYYMYHGGTQFVGKRGNTGLMAFSYDFQGALREFGKTSPIYDYLKPANFFLEDFPELLAPTVVALPANPVTDKANTTDLRYGARVNGESGFLFLNNYQDRVKMTEKKGLNINLAFKGKTLRIPEKGGFELKPNQFAVLPFNLNLQGVKLDYALAQLYTRTKTDDGKEVFVFFVPEGMDGHFVFDSDSIAELTAKSATVTKEGKRTTMAVQPGTDCVMQVKSKTGGQCEILTLTREQALRLTRQDIFGRQRLVLSDSDVLSAEGKLRVSNIGHTKLDFAVFPAPKGKLAASAGAFANAEGVSDGIFRRYTIQVPEVKPDITFEGIGSNEVKVTAGPKAFDGAHDVFLEVIYMGNVAQLKQDGALLAENLFNRTPWKIGLNRFREKLAKAPLEMNISPLAPIVEVVDNIQVNSGGVKMELPKSAMLVGNFQVTAPPADGKEKGFVSSISVLPEYAAWVETETASNR